MGKPPDDRVRRLGIERRLRIEEPRPGRIALGFPNRYDVGMSNLGFQWTLKILSEVGTGCERFFIDGPGAPRTMETGRSIAQFPVVAWSISWEMDMALVLQGLKAAGIPLRREDRNPRDPLIVFGGNCARINPAPLFDYVDLVAAGDAEKLAPILADAVAEHGRNRDDLLEALAAAPGFYVPGETDDSPAPVEIQQKRPREGFGVPHSVILTPETELSDKLLIEIARGCTEMCRFCWAAYAFAPIVRHSAAEILDVAAEGRELTGRVGLIATAVADHPEISTILSGLAELDFHIALSSIKIDALDEPLLEVLRRQGEKALAIAPEAGNEVLRRKINKKVSDQMLDEKMRLIFQQGFSHLKLYLQIGLPGETDADIADLVELVRRAHDLALEEGRKLGRVATVVASVNAFVPKPHTPFAGEVLAEVGEIERKTAWIEREIRKIPNTILRAMPAREAVWESWLAKAGPEAGRILEEMAAGSKPRRLLKTHAAEIGRIVWGADQDRHWDFLKKRIRPARPAPEFAGELHT